MLRSATDLKGFTIRRRVSIMSTPDLHCPARAATSTIQRGASLARGHDIPHRAEREAHRRVV